jgi:hypothetical protein
MDHNETVKQMRLQEAKPARICSQRVRKTTSFQRKFKRQRP